MGISKQELVSMLEVGLERKVECNHYYTFKHFCFLSINRNELIKNNFFQEEELKTAILVVLANKQDIEGAMSVTEVSSNV